MNAMPRPTSRAKAPIRIGIVNNMPDAALAATERQFTRLLESAPCAFGIDLRLFYLPEIARGEAAQMQLRAHYAPIDTLPHASVDALIVTGCEPLRSSLADEPYYPSLTRLIDWAKDNTVSTIWSCLAAHAAVLHLDGIRREKLPSKLAGVYEFARMSDHPLLCGMTEPVRVPHSRLNGLSSDELVGHGYELLIHSKQAGVDAFVKKYPSLFLFLQGHPEYEPDSLYREYRRDMTRYLTGQQETCPALPQNYFNRKAAAAFNAFAEEARAKRTPHLLEHLPAVEDTWLRRDDWRTSSARLFASWIGYIADTKARQPHLAREHVTV
ncbi:MAG: homoserine O-succinyltransferase/O-acetyltransferase [Methylobacteriaceae bacterium]|jgi:homoserine O-succinyltransferase|nr:homoserine O-succinyltransferase/O-acetyltransferase [Methylobacteriaceae bacterium]